MHETGVLRRIDDLGRLVVPREVRRTMCIAEGDVFECCYDDYGVYFKRRNMGDDVMHVLDVLYETVADQDYEQEYYERLAPLMAEMRKVVRDIDSK